jgi:hypothetical protein
MTGKIFINYRRGDDPGHTGRLFDRLQDAFAPEQLFLDIDNIAPGLDFVRVLHERVAECDVVLAVIGKNWIDARDANGARRLDDPDDFVRIEITSALSQDKRVIPVLVGDAHMPRPEQLPDALKPLARRNAVRLTYERFRADMQGLIKALQQALAEIEAAHTVPAHAGGARARQQANPAPANARPLRPAIVAAVALAMVFAAGAALFLGKTMWSPSPASRPAAVAAATPSAPVAAAPAAPITNVPEAPAPTSATAANTATSPAYAPVAMKHVKKDVSLGYLNLRAGPGQDQKILARIPAGAANVAVTGTCVSPRDGTSGYPFCPVEWNGAQGWVSSNGLE